MAVQSGVQQSIMNFAHKKLQNFMPIVTHSDSLMFVRGHNDHNDSRQKAGVAPLELHPLTDDEVQIFQDRFAINDEHVRRAFSAL